MYVGGGGDPLPYDAVEYNIHAYADISFGSFEAAILLPDYPVQFWESTWHCRGAGMRGRNPGVSVNVPSGHFMLPPAKKRLQCDIILHYDSRGWVSSNKGGAVLFTSYPLGALWRCAPPPPNICVSIIPLLRSLNRFIWE